MLKYIDFFPGLTMNWFFISLVKKEEEKFAASRMILFSLEKLVNTLTETVFRGNDFGKRKEIGTLGQALEFYRG